MGDKNEDGISGAYGEGNITLLGSDGEVLWTSNGKHADWTLGGEGLHIFFEFTESGDFVSLTDLSDLPVVDYEFDYFNDTGLDDDIFANASFPGEEEFFPETDDPKWPGAFPSSPDAIAFNMRTDDHPDEITWTWSRLSSDGVSWDDEKAGGPYAAQRQLESAELSVKPDSIYRMIIFDSLADGTCCMYGKGWFTFTVANTTANSEGSVLFNATGLDFKEMDIFIHVDSTGLVLHVPSQFLQEDAPLSVDRHGADALP